jgi:hypothetical protein
MANRKKLGQVYNVSLLRDFWRYQHNLIEKVNAEKIDLVPIGATKCLPS